MTTLHVTNGDSVAGTLQKIVPRDEAVLPWRDVLHDGPVPGRVDAAQLLMTRANFLAGRGWAQYELVLADLKGRDAALAAMGAGDHVTLWFEPDLYDQLQLLQILTRLYVRALDRRPSIAIVASDELLGRLSESQLAQYIDRQRVVREVDLELAAHGWEAFTSADDSLLHAFAITETALFEANSYHSDASTVLPHIHSAIRRLLQEFPSPRNGLSRSEQQMVNALKSGARSMSALFKAAHAPNEDFAWLGDTSFAWYVRRLMRGAYPLIEFAEARDPSGSPAFDADDDALFRSPTVQSELWKREVRLTDIGHAVGEGTAHAVQLNGIDRWIGGVHLEAVPPPPL